MAKVSKFEEAEGMGGIEKIPNGKGAKRKKAEGEKPKERKKRTSLKNMPLAGDAPVIAIPRAAEIQPAETEKASGEVLAEKEVRAEPAIKEIAELNPESEAQMKKDFPLDPTAALEHIERKKNSILKKIKEGRLTTQEKNDREELYVVFPRADQPRFSKLTREEQDMLWAAQKKANKEIDAALDKKSFKVGQVEEDEFDASSKEFVPGAYHNGSNPHDAEEAFKEKSKQAEKAPEGEKELDPEELKVVIEDIEGAWKDLAGIYQEDEKDKVLILKGKIAGYGKRQLVNIFGVSKEQANKIVIETIDKILAK